MPKDEFDFDDPMELNGVGFVCTEDTTDAMTECFVEEFMRLGHNPRQILAMFHNPHYLGMNLALEKRGEPFVRDTISEVFARWGRVVTWPGATEIPLTSPSRRLLRARGPALSPSDSPPRSVLAERGGERENCSPSQREPVAAGSTSDFEISETRSSLFPLPRGGGEGQGEGAGGVDSSVSHKQATESGDSLTDPMGSPLPKLNV